MSKRATIEDVARIAGVSTATVSRAIHTPGVVSDSTREAVNGAIERTGYTLNLAARNLRQQRSNAIVVLVPDIGNTFFSEILAGIERVASAAGQTILIGHTAQDPLREVQFLNSLANGQADGALLLNGHLPASVIGKLNGLLKRRLPIVSISEALSEQVVPHVGIDNEKAAEMATQYLLDHGHQDIVHVSGPTASCLTSQRIKGFERAMASARTRVDEASIVEGAFSIASGIRAANEIMARKALPDAVFCANDEMAIGLMSQFSRHGIDVPGDVSVIGFDDIAFSETSHPPLTTIHQPRSEFGERAANTLLGLIGGGHEHSELVEILPTVLIERASVARREDR